MWAVRTEPTTQAGAEIMIQSWLHKSLFLRSFLVSHVKDFSWIDEKFSINLLTGISVF